MDHVSKFKKLIEPGYIGKIRTRNHILKTGTGLNFHSPNDGFMNEQSVNFYEVLARGGAGLIVTGHTSIDSPLGSSSGKGYCLDDDKYIPSFSKLVDAVHKYDCPAFLQILHAGPWHRTQFSGLQPIAASALKKSEMPKPQLDETRELSVAELQRYVEKFANAAIRLKKAGYDGVEVNGAASHLINTFLSRAWNKREDDYGYHNLENRARFVVEIIKEIKRLNGKDFPIITIINGAEYGLKNGITSEESKGIARILQDAGSDAIHIRAEYYLEQQTPDSRKSVHLPELVFYPEPPDNLDKEVDASGHGAGAWVPLATGLKNIISIPVIAVGGLNAELGEKILEQGKADFISLNRPLMADPELPNKIVSGKYDEVIKCMHCSVCFNCIETGKPVQCRTNPVLGKNLDYIEHKAEQKKKVLVAGGGPAGLEVATTAARRGHEVFLYEKKQKLGGLVPMAAMVKGQEIEDLCSFIDYYQGQIEKLGIRLHLGREVNESAAREISPDVIVLATGGKYAAFSLPGLDKRKVLKSYDLHKKLDFYLKIFKPRFLRMLTKFWMPVGKSAIILGSNIQGCELAEFLVKRGRTVTIVDTSHELGTGMPEVTMKEPLLTWLTKKGVVMITGVKYEEITDKGLVITTEEGEKQTIEADTVIPIFPFESETELREILGKEVSEIYQIGDCKEPRLILDAIADGSVVGRNI